jgi:hypothetical protein
METICGAITFHLGLAAGLPVHRHGRNRTQLVGATSKIAQFDFGGRLIAGFRLKIFE